MHHVLEDLPAQTRRVQDFLARRGWYLSGRIMPKEIATLDNYISQNDENAIEDFMINYTKEYYKDIKSSVINTFSNRANILYEAFKIHENKVYQLSVPVMLIQADGISYELLNVSFYSKIKGKPRTATAKYKLQHTQGSLTEIVFLRPLEIMCSIAVDTKDRDKERIEDKLYGPLNRHGIIHGIDVDYASQTNSFRAILILDYLNDLKRFYFKV